MAEDESRDHSKSSLPLSFIVNCKDKPEKQEKKDAKNRDTQTPADRYMTIDREEPKGGIIKEVHTYFDRGIKITFTMSNQSVDVTYLMEKQIFNPHNRKLSLWKEVKKGTLKEGEASSILSRTYAPGLECKTFDFIIGLRKFIDSLKHEKKNPVGSHIVNLPRTFDDSLPRKLFSTGSRVTESSPTNAK
ncbi:MAG: hypothetical protein IPK04_12185 [Bdellovibrionales bacterium]|nr:hypothetical protein [Bdellovibrionales bacterium]